jgi:Rps23 Pro-64 3,4-dihydroxylase Tpa1-like proline 4-hydroxylase
MSCWVAAKAKVLPKHCSNALERVGGLDSFFGGWLRDESRRGELKAEYQGRCGFNFVVIENFLHNDVAKSMAKSFPDIAPGNYHRYCNPIELKFAFDDIHGMGPSASDFFHVANSAEFTAVVAEIAGIPNLESDPHLHGAGLHAHPRGGILLPHLDYSIHPMSGKERRLNIILYLNEQWDPSFNGETTLFDPRMTPIAKVFPKFNRAVLFRTNDVSWHGVVPQIACPGNVVRKSAAIYYVSDPQEGVQQREKAMFTHSPGDAPSTGMMELLEVRQQRRITEEDIAKHFPDWRTKLKVEPHAVFFSDITLNMSS